MANQKQEAEDRTGITESESTTYGEQQLKAPKTIILADTPRERMKEALKLMINLEKKERENT